MYNYWSILSASFSSLVYFWFYMLGFLIHRFSTQNTAGFEAPSVNSLTLEWRPGRRARGCLHHKQVRESRFTLSRMRLHYTPTNGLRRLCLTCNSEVVSHLPSFSAPTLTPTFDERYLHSRPGFQLQWQTTSHAICTWVNQVIQSRS